MHSAERIQSNASSRWLYGPTIDLLFGCGILYVVFFLLLLVGGKSVEAVFPLALTPLIALFLSIPHYGSTLLRVYERPEDRYKYRFFSVYMAAGILIWFVVSIYNSLAGALLVTLYLVWSPWHYMGQNYGIALMFLGRRNISISPKTKRLFHLSFLCSYFLALTEMQSFPSSSGFYQVMTLELASDTRDILFTIFGSIYLYATASVAITLKKQASIADLIPTALLFVSQALWFLVPLAAIRFGLFQNTVALSMDHAVYAFFWVAIAHAIQYLWITGYYAKKSDQGIAISAFLGKALAAGALIWVIPVFIFSPNFIGNQSYDAGLAILIAAAVNIHHFVLDGAIWKLREGKIAEVLLRNVSSVATPVRNGARTYLRPALYSVGIICVLAHYLGTVTSVRAQQGITEQDLSKTNSALSTLELLQRDTVYLQSSSARLAAAQGDFDQAARHAKRAIRLDPSEGNRKLLALIEQSAEASGVAPPAPNTSIPLQPYAPRHTKAD